MIFLTDRWLLSNSSKYRSVVSCQIGHNKIGTTNVNWSTETDPNRKPAITKSGTELVEHLPYSPGLAPIVYISRFVLWINDLSTLSSVYPKRLYKWQNLNEENVKYLQCCCCKYIRGAEEWQLGSLGFNYDPESSS